MSYFRVHGGGGGGTVRCARVRAIVVSVHLRGRYNIKKWVSAVPCRAYSRVSSRVEFNINKYEDSTRSVSLASVCVSLAAAGSNSYS